MTPEQKAELVDKMTEVVSQCHKAGVRFVRNIYEVRFADGERIDLTDRDVRDYISR
jgi:hypothetical protein